MSAPGQNNLVATVSLTELVLLMPALNKKGEFDPLALRQRIEDLLGRMTESSPLKIRLALGHYFPGVGGAARSYQVALATLAVGKEKQPGQSAFFYADLKLPVLLDSLRTDWQADELRKPLQALVENDRHGQLVKTLEAWFAHGMQMGATAQALRIHRNTLDYRIRRIQDLCAVDLSRTEDCLALYLALQMTASH